MAKRFSNQYTLTDQGDLAIFITIKFNSTRFPTCTVVPLIKVAR